MWSRRRGLVTAVVIVVVLLGTSVPAGAKGPTEVSVTGRGLGRSIVLAYDITPSMSEIVAATRVIDLIFGGAGGIGGGSITSAGRPTPDLGARLRLRWTIPTGDGPNSADHIEQELYLYARGGPLLWTAPGQSVYGRTTASGWLRADAALVELLHAAGVPSAERLRTAGRACSVAHAARVGPHACR